MAIFSKSSLAPTGVAEVGIRVADDLRPATPADHDALFRAYRQIVDAGDGFPHVPPLSRADFDEYWIAHTPRRSGSSGPKER